MKDRYQIVGSVGFVSREAALRALRNGRSIIVTDSAGVPCQIDSKTAKKAAFAQTSGITASREEKSK